MLHALCVFNFSVQKVMYFISISQHQNGHDFLDIEYGMFSVYRSYVCIVYVWVYLRNDHSLYQIFVYSLLLLTRKSYFAPETSAFSFTVSSFLSNYYVVGDVL